MELSQEIAAKIQEEVSNAMKLHKLQHCKPFDIPVHRELNDALEPCTTTSAVLLDGVQGALDDLAKQCTRAVDAYEKVKAVQEKKYVENITIPVYEYLDDQDNQRAKSSYTFNMTPVALQNMISNLAKRCSYTTSQYFAKAEHEKSTDSKQVYLVIPQHDEYDKNSGSYTACPCRSYYDRCDANRAVFDLAMACDAVTKAYIELRNKQEEKYGLPDLTSDGQKAQAEIPMKFHDVLRYGNRLRDRLIDALTKVAELEKSTDSNTLPEIVVPSHHRYDPKTKTVNYTISGVVDNPKKLAPAVYDLAKACDDAALAYLDLKSAQENKETIHVQVPAFKATAVAGNLVDTETKVIYTQKAIQSKVEFLAGLVQIEATERARLKEQLVGLESEYQRLHKKNRELEEEKKHLLGKVEGKKEKMECFYDDVTGSIKLLVADIVATHKNL